MFSLVRRLSPHVVKEGAKHLSRRSFSQGRNTSQGFLCLSSSLREFSFFLLFSSSSPLFSWGLCPTHSFQHEKGSLPSSVTLSSSSSSTELSSSTSPSFGFRVIQGRDSPFSPSPSSKPLFFSTTSHALNSNESKPPEETLRTAQNVDQIKILLDMGKDIEEEEEFKPTYHDKSPHKRTALISACWRKDIESVKLLLQHKANPNHCVSKGEIKSPLETAIYGNSRDIFEMLISAGANINYIPESPDSLSPLILAFQKGDSDIANRLLDLGADVNQRDQEGKTPLMMAAQQCPSQLVSRLLAAGSNVNDVDNNGKTALMFACESNDYHTTKLLLISGADRNIVDKTGKSAADYSRQHFWSHTLRFFEGLSFILSSFLLSPFFPSLLLVLLLFLSLELMD